MAEALFGDGLIFEDVLPVSWAEGKLAEGVPLARLNADNHQLLGAEASLDDVRGHEALKDESPALVQELQRLEFKVNMLLRLTAELARRDSALPPAQRVRMTSRGLEWFGAQTLSVGATGLLSLYMNSALPQPIRISGVVEGERMDEGMPVVQVRFSGMSDAVVEQLEKFIFRHHRRLVAGARRPT